MFVFSDFLDFFFDTFYWLITTDIFLTFVYIFVATGIVVLIQKLVKMVLSI